MVTSSFRFSTGNLPLHARGKALHELRDRGVLPLEPLPGCEVDVRIAKWFLPGAGVLSGSLCGVRQDAGPRTPDAGDDLFFGVNVTGGSTAIQRGRRIALGDGDAILLSCDAGPFTILRPGPVRFLGLRVPRKTLGPLIASFDDASVRFIPGQTDALRLLSTYVSAATNIDVLASAEIAHLVATHLHDLI